MTTTPRPYTAEELDAILRSDLAMADTRQLATVPAADRWLDADEQVRHDFAALLAELENGR